MAVTLANLRAALRVDQDTETDEVLTRLLAVAQATVERHAPDAPTAVKDEAETRIAGYLYDMPESPSGDRFAAAFINSGAKGLLSPYKVRRAGAV